MQYPLSGAILLKELVYLLKLKTFTVAKFENFSRNVVPTLAQTFSEDLKSSVLSQTRLNYLEVNGDLEFSGAITEYSISPIAPQANETTQFSRLQISVEINYFSVFNEEDSWTSRFSRFADYESTANFYITRRKPYCRHSRANH